MQMAFRLIVLFLSSLFFSFTWMGQDSLYTNAPYWWNWNEKERNELINHFTSVIHPPQFEDWFQERRKRQLKVESWDERLLFKEKEKMKSRRKRRRVSFHVYFWSFSYKVPSFKQSSSFLPCEQMLVKGKLISLFFFSLVHDFVRMERKERKGEKMERKERKRKDEDRERGMEWKGKHTGSRMRIDTHPSFLPHNRSS